MIMFYCLRLLLGPVIETLVLLDRLLYLRERGRFSLIIHFSFHLIIFIHKSLSANSLEKKYSSKIKKDQRTISTRNNMKCNH